MKKIYYIPILTIISLGLVACGNSNKETEIVEVESQTSSKILESESLPDTTTVEETTNETYYEYDEKINEYICNYNQVNTDNKIKKKKLSRYYHHGSDHDDQAILYMNDFEIVISNDFSGIEVVIQGNKAKTTDEYNHIFCRFAKAYNQELDDETLNDYWKQLLDDITNNIEFEDFECDITMYDDTIEYIVLEGN